MHFTVSNKHRASSSFYDVGAKIETKQLPFIKFMKIIIALSIILAGMMFILK
ncbi:MAG: hypothetical protein ACW99A_17855 [Candidatus Kariarchaeaceae archaeon]